MALGAVGTGDASFPVTLCFVVSALVPAHTEAFSIAGATQSLSPSRAPWSSSLQLVSSGVGQKWGAEYVPVTSASWEYSISDPCPVSVD